MTLYYYLTEPAYSTFMSSSLLDALDPERMDLQGGRYIGSSANRYVFQLREVLPLACQSTREDVTIREDKLQLFEPRSFEAKKISETQ